MEWILLAVSLLLMVASGGFVAAEFSFVTVDRSEVSRAAASGDRAATGVQNALHSLSTHLSGAQIGITLTNLAIGYLAEPAVAAVLKGPLSNLGLPGSTVMPVALTIGLVLATFLTMTFGELVPKNIAIALPLQTAKATQAGMRAFTTVMHYPIRLLNGSANAVVRLLGAEPQEELRSARSSDELASLAGRSADQGTLDTEIAHLVQRSIAFGPRTAGEIMTPRVQMATVEVGHPVSEVIELSGVTGFSKFPVTKGSSDNIVGSVHVKQAVAVPRSERSSRRIREVMVPATVVPESLRLDPLLSLLRGEGFQIAVVSDEYGGTAGVVTLEDVVEEIVGDIADEHDRFASSKLRRRPDGSWIISGLLRPDELRDATGVALPEDDDYDTVAGLLVQVLGRIPVPGDVTDIRLPLLIPDDPDEDPAQEFARLRVERMDGLRVDRISVRQLSEQEAGQ